MFDTGKAEVTFDAGAGRTVTMAHHHERGFELHLRDGEKPFPQAPDEAGPGEFRVTALVRQPRPELTSRAPCKAAYLTLVVHAPELALRDEFAVLRRWLSQREVGDARPHGEKLVMGAAPGAQFAFRVGCEAEGGKMVSVSWATAFVRFGVVGYVVALLGDPTGFDGMLARDPEVDRFDDPRLHGRERSMTFSFGFNGMRRVGRSGVVAEHARLRRCSGQLLDAEPAVQSDGEQPVDEVVARLQGDNHAAEDFELLFAAEAAVEEQHDAGVEVAGRGELAEVGHVRGDQDAVLGEGEFEDLRVGDAQPPAFAEVGRVVPVGA